LFPSRTYLILEKAGKEARMAEKRKIARRDFAYYMQVTNDITKELLGYLSDISTGGFKLDSQKQITPGQDFRVHIELTPDIADKNAMVFVARSKWCHRDHIDPNTYNVGFEIVNMLPSDMTIFQRMFEKYGTENRLKNRNSDDYLWR
jgi:hypothetical protein